MNCEWHVFFSQSDSDQPFPTSMKTKALKPRADQGGDFVPPALTFFSVPTPSWADPHSTSSHIHWRSESFLGPLTQQNTEGLTQQPKPEIKKLTKLKKWTRATPE